MVNMIIPGSIMFSDDNELAEVRAIEEGFKRAYDEDPKGTAEAINELRDFAVRLIRLKATAENVGKKNPDVEFQYTIGASLLYDQTIVQLTAALPPEYIDGKG
jgi:hypothetical protein